MGILAQLSLVAVHTMGVSMKIFSHRQTKLVKIKLRLQCLSYLCAGRCSSPEFASAPDDSWCCWQTL